MLLYPDKLFRPQNTSVISEVYTTSCNVYNNFKRQICNLVTGEYEMGWGSGVPGVKGERYTKNFEKFDDKISLEKMIL